MLIAITQRRNPEYGGADVLEANYTNYYNKLGVTLVPIPNNARHVRKYFDQLKVDGIILSGGGDVQPSLYQGIITLTGDYSLERDETERTLLEIALEEDLPVLGICRGMESINVNFGGRLIQSMERDLKGALNHRRTRHGLTLSEDSIVSSMGTNTFEVNSYHDLGIGRQQLSPQLVPFAFAGDQTIEGFYHPEHAIAGIMWHPERETSPHALNDFLINAFLSRQLFWEPRRGQR